MIYRKHNASLLRPGDMLHIDGRWYQATRPLTYDSRYLTLSRRLTKEELQDREDVTHYSDMEFVRKSDWSVKWDIPSLVMALETNTYRIG